MRTRLRRRRSPRCAGASRQRSGAGGCRALSPAISFDAPTSFETSVSSRAAESALRRGYTGRLRHREPRPGPGFPRRPARMARLGDRCRDGRSANGADHGTRGRDRRPCDRGRPRDRARNRRPFPAAEARGRLRTAPGGATAHAGGLERAPIACTCCTRRRVSIPARGWLPYWALGHVHTRQELSGDPRSTTAQPPGTQSGGDRRQGRLLGRSGDPAAPVVDSGISAVRGKASRWPRREMRARWTTWSAR